MSLSAFEGQNEMQLFYKYIKPRKLKNKDTTYWIHLKNYLNDMRNEKMYIFAS